MAEINRFSAESGTAFTPFWHRLPHFFRYPMQTGSLMRIAGYSAIAGFSMLLPDVFGGVLRLILWIVFLKYAFLVMERTANGQFDEPNDLGSEKGDAAQVMRQFGLIVIIGLLFGMLAYMFGEFGYGVGWLLMNIVPPAGIMIIAVTRSLGEAVNPARIVFFIRTIGSPYFALCFVLLSVTGSGQWLQGFLYRHIESWLALPILSFVEFYFALITYHMMGYAIYQYHDELGVHADVSFEEAEAKLEPGKAVDPVLARLNSLIVNGQQDEAIELLRDELRTRWGNNDLHDRYQKLLVAAGKHPAALNHGREFVAKLVSEKRFFQALDLCEQCLKIDPEFQLQDSNRVHELASAAYTGKRCKLALDLMRRFDKRNPGHPHIPSVYLLSAQILGDHFQMYREAIQILSTLQARFPDHAAAKEAHQYMQTLSKFTAVG